MIEATPFPVIWDGEVFKPATPYWQSKAEHRFVAGQKYLMIEQLERSINAHRHYFANLYEAYTNLPEDRSWEFPDLEVFRHRGLIATGWRDETVIACKDGDEAHKVAALVQQYDRFALVVVSGNLVTILRARSQSMRLMGAKDFQKSKIDVLGWAWNLCGIDPETGEINTGRAA